MVIEPLGSDTVRKIAASISECTSMFCIHSGMAARATSTPAARPNASKEILVRALRDNFNLHLLHADVVGNVFRHHGQAVASGSKFVRHHDFSCACGFIGVPAQADRGSALKLVDHR